MQCFVLIGRCPHPFQVIEFPDFRTEHVDDDVTGIDQHPVSGLQPFDTSATKALVLQVG
jgi:hypothetical protein